MYDVLLVIGFIALLLFGGIALFGAPFLPTLSSRVEEGIALVGLKKGQTLLELGSGDGRLLKVAAQQGYFAIGYELNPLLVLYSKFLTFRYRKQVKVIWGSYWEKDWPEFDGIYTFLLQPYMSKLHKKVIQQADGRHFNLVSFGFEIREKKPAKSQNGMFLYKY